MVLHRLPATSRQRYPKSLVSPIQLPVTVIILIVLTTTEGSTTEATATRATTVAELHSVIVAPPSSYMRSILLLSCAYNSIIAAHRISSPDSSHHYGTIGYGLDTIHIMSYHLHLDTDWINTIAASNLDTDWIHIIASSHLDKAKIEESPCITIIYSCCRAVLAMGYVIFIIILFSIHYLFNIQRVLMCLYVRMMYSIYPSIFHNENAL